MKFLILVSIFFCGIFYCTAGYSHKENLYNYGENGHALDKAHYESGSALDILYYDLLEALAQGREVPSGVIEECAFLRQQLHREFVELDNQRKDIRSELHLEYPVAHYTVAVENLKDVPGSYYNWVGFCSFSLSWQDGTTVEIPLKSFAGCVYNPLYNNGKNPGASIFLYGRQSGSYIGVSEFALPVPLPAGDAVLRFGGMDCDKGGNPTPVKISIFGNPVFEGENPFPKIGTSSVEVIVPSEFFNVERKFSGENPELGKVIAEFEESIKNFRMKALNRNSAILAKSRKYVENLVWRPVKKTDVTNENFVLALDLNDVEWGNFKYPGFNYNYEHIAKMSSEARLDRVSAYISRLGGSGEVMKSLKEFDKYTTVPFTVWAVDGVFDHDDIVSTTYFGNFEKLRGDYQKFTARFDDLKNCTGIQVDEPIIRNEESYGKLTANKKLMAAYTEYAAVRNPTLALRGLSALPDSPFDGVPNSDEEWVAYMEYQYFKTGFMADHYRKLYDMATGNGDEMSIVVMDMNCGEPSAGSYVSMGKVLPYIGTDLYDNGSIRESFSMQLLNSAASGKAIMWPGAGYSCRSPRTFERSLVNGLAWADGIHLWTLMYCAKYRDANAFWAYGGEKLCKDDREGDLLDNWQPEFWDVFCNFAGVVKDNQELFNMRDSINPVALLVSERTLFALEKPHRGNATYFLDNVGLYSEIAGNGIPVDVRYVENFAGMKRPSYQAVVLADAVCLSDDEVEGLRNFVRSGGLLIVAGESGTRNEWNLPRIGNERLTAFSDFGAGRMMIISESRIGEVMEAIPNCGLAGRISPEYSELLLKELKHVTNKWGVDISAPYGTVVAFQQNRSGVVAVLVDYMDERSKNSVKMEFEEQTLNFDFCGYMFKIIPSNHVALD